MQVSIKSSDGLAVPAQVIAFRRVETKTSMARYPRLQSGIRFCTLPIGPHIRATLAVSMTGKRGSRSDSRITSGHRSPLFAIQWLQ